VPWDTILKEYWQVRGRTPQGLPTKAKLKELKLDDVAAELKLPDEAAVA
jgi:hypothetical protein